MFKLFICLTVKYIFWLCTFLGVYYIALDTVTFPLNNSWNFSRIHEQWILEIILQFRIIIFDIVNKMFEHFIGNYIFLITTIWELGVR